MVTPAVESHAAACSGAGLIRSNNQDLGYAGMNLLILVDSMGEPVGGDIASSVALAHLVPLDTDTHTTDLTLALLYDALIDAHDESSGRSRRDPDLEGLGVTCITIIRSGNRLATVYIEDSHAHALRGTVPTQVTTDHSFVQCLVETGQVILEEAEHHPNCNVVLCILGNSQANITPDETMREAVLDDHWLLCSDGLFGVVSPETIGSALAEIKGPGQRTEELIRLALRANGPDNVTCVIAGIVNSGSFPSTPPQIVDTAALDRNTAPREGSSATARAVALGNKKGSDLDEDDLDLGEKRRPWFPFLTTASMTLVLVVADWGGWTWTQNQYYMTGQDRYVVVHQGIPRSLGPWGFSHSTEAMDIALKDLSSMNRQRLRDPVMRSSREQIDGYPAQLRSSLETSGEDTEGSQSGTSTSPGRMQPVYLRINNGASGSTVEA